MGIAQRSGGLHLHIHSLVLLLRCVSETSLSLFFYRLLFVIRWFIFYFSLFFFLVVSFVFIFRFLYLGVGRHAVWAWRLVGWSSHPLGRSVATLWGWLVSCLFGLVSISCRHLVWTQNDTRKRNTRRREEERQRSLLFAFPSSAVSVVRALCARELCSFRCCPVLFLCFSLSSSPLSLFLSRRECLITRWSGGFVFERARVSEATEKRKPTRHDTFQLVCMYVSQRPSSQMRASILARFFQPSEKNNYISSLNYKQKINRTHHVKCRQQSNDYRKMRLSYSPPMSMEYHYKISLNDDCE